jgi:rhodanese-related sulfurtransferase
MKMWGWSGCGFIPFACKAKGERQHEDDFLRLATRAKTKIRQIHPFEVLDLVEDGVLLLDVREQDEYAKGHLHGSIHLSQDVLEMKIGALATDKSAPIVCYCNGGSRAALAAAILQGMGYRRVFSIDGGMNAAQAAGLSVEPRKED